MIINLRTSLFITVFIFHAVCSLAQQQENRLPTEEELNEKIARYNTWEWWGKLPTGSMPATNGQAVFKNDGQNPIPFITGPEQDCGSSIPLCTSSSSQSSAYNGVGTSNEVSGSTCLPLGEVNSVWYVFTAQTTGSFGFDIDPGATTDYDWALYNLDSIGGCSGVPTSLPIRCNYSAVKGNTGLTVSGITEMPAISSPSTDPPYDNGFEIRAGKNYALVINNFTGSSSGYDINFTGTGSIVDGTKPTINPPNTVVNNCNNTITVNFSEPVKCSSIAADGSDFTITGGGTVTAATGVGCSYASQVIITYTAPSTGSYTIGVQTGGDGNTILDKCDNAMLTSQTVSFTFLDYTLTPSVTSLCSGAGTVDFVIAGGPASTTVTLNPGGLSGSTDGSGNYTFSSVAVSTTTTFTSSITYAGCTKTKTTTVTVGAPIVTVAPVNPQICSGTTNLTANTTNCPGCTYSWTGGQTTQTANTLAAGTYTVTVTTSGGCTSTASSTISLASGGSGSNCFVYYVNSYNGTTDDGTTKATPTSLLDALSKAQCTSALIKMTTGIYNFTDRVTVSGSMTLEGGFNSDFTSKTSNLSGGTNSTTIRRSNSADAGYPTFCTAFYVASNSLNFRFQDIRIELPGNSSGTVAALAASSGISTYGVQLGTGCSGYEFVRCYIDAGVGANP